MLRFHGIRSDQLGRPERYTLALGLLESLQAGLYIHNCYQGEQKRVLKAIDSEIDHLYRPGVGRTYCKTNLRQAVARSFRKRDIMRFIYRDANYLELKLAIAKILTSAAKIESKWGQIQVLLVEYVYPLSVEARERLICSGSSEFHKIMQMITLLFLEQDGEVPPANLELQFVRNQFPKVLWKKREGIYSEEDPFWQPQSPLCKVTYLVARILSSCFEEEKKELVVIGSEKSAKSKQAVEKQPDERSYPFSRLIPQETPDSIEITHGYEEQPQLSVVPETVPETLLSIQKQIQKEFSHEGVKHFLGILRQFSESNGSYCSFNTYKHLKLVAKLNKNGQGSDHQRKLFESVLARLSKLKVTRSWNHAEEPFKVTTPFIMKMGCKKVLENESRSTMEYSLDPMFELNRDNPYLLGQHLQLIPEELFKESSLKHSLIAGIASYLTGTWLHESCHHKGSIKKTAFQIIEGCAFNVTSANRYRIRNKLNSELNYMRERSYIGKMDLKYSPVGNPWEDIYEISPPEYYQEKLGPMLARNSERLCG